MHPENRVNYTCKSETFNYTIRDREGRLWEVVTNANCDIVSSAIRFLRNVSDINIPELVVLLERYDYSVEANLVRQPSIDFEL